MMKSVINVPLEDLPTVTRFPIRYLRNKANFRGGSIASYFSPKMFMKCFVKGWRNPLDEKRLVFDDSFNFRFDDGSNDRRPRFGHIDFGLKHDSTGVSLGYLHSLVKLEIEYVEGEEYTDEFVPVVGIDFLGRISAEFFPEKEVVIRSVRQLFFECMRRGANISLVTADGFQSWETIQTFKQEGVLSGRLSIDNTISKLIIEDGVLRSVATKNPAAAMDALWLVTKEKRLRCMRHPWLEKEAQWQEKDLRTGKVVKMPGTTDDLIQSLAGTVFNVVENQRYAGVEIVGMDSWKKQLMDQEEIEYQKSMDDPMYEFRRREFDDEDGKDSLDLYEFPDDVYGDDILGGF